MIKSINRNRKLKTVLVIAMCIMVFFVICFSSFYLVNELNHDCTGEDCPICEVIHMVETLTNIGFSSSGTLFSSFILIFSIISLIINSDKVIIPSPVLLKVRIDS